IEETPALPRIRSRVEYRLQHAERRHVFGRHRTAATGRGLSERPGGATDSRPNDGGRFCRRFENQAIEQLKASINQKRLKGWAKKSEEFFEMAIVDADGTLAETGGECKEGIDVAYNGVWGYHPLVISLANTQEPLFLVNRPGNRPSHEGAAARLDQ